MAALVKMRSNIVVVVGNHVATGSLLKRSHNNNSNKNNNQRKEQKQKDYIFSTVHGKNNF
jgi:UDP-N-acetylglucosamine 2-epimerase